MKIVTVTANPALDKYLFFDTFSCGGLNRASKVEAYPSGKGINVSLALLGLGVKTVVLALAAGRTGRFIEESMKALGLETAFIYVPGETRTDLKLVEAAPPRVTEVNEPGPYAGPETVELLTQAVLGQADTADLVVFSGSLPPGLPQSFYADMTAHLRELGVMAAVDADGEALRLAVEAGPCWIKPNRAEAQRLLGRVLESRDDFRTAAAQLMQMGAGAVVISDGPAGALFASPAGAVWARFAGTVEILSPFGCGDAMLAGTLLAWLQRGSLVETARLGVAVATAAAMCKGTTFASAERVRAAMDMVQVEEM